MPRIVIHRCSASITTNTPRGLSACSIDSAISVVSRSWTCGFFARVSTTRAIFDSPVICWDLLGMYATCALPLNGIRWCSHIEYSGISRTMIISSKSAPSTTVTICEASTSMPAKISLYIRATRAGVSRSPPRSGSSPIPRRIIRTPSSIAAASNRSFTARCYRGAPRTRSSADTGVELQVELLHRGPYRHGRGRRRRRAASFDDRRHGVGARRKRQLVGTVGAGDRLLDGAVRRRRADRPRPHARRTRRPRLLHRACRSDRHTTLDAAGGCCRARGARPTERKHKHDRDTAHRDETPAAAVAVPDQLAYAAGFSVPMKGRFRYFSA